MDFEDLKFFTALGILVAAYYAINLLLFLLRKCCARTPNLLQRYGHKGTYAVVTGGSDGIGLGICHELAAQGFNICIMSRNEAKIQEKLAEIKGKFPAVETKCVVADLGKFTTMADYNTLVSD